MNTADRVMQSYERCCASTGLFDDFYRHFLASPPQIRAEFATTDMTVQKHLLHTGAMSLVMYAHGVSGNKLHALSAGHSHTTPDVRPEPYDLWLDALLMAVAEHDHNCDTKTRDAWRDAMGHGIIVIESHHWPFRARWTIPLSPVQSRRCLPSLPEARVVQVLGASSHLHQLQRR